MPEYSYIAIDANGKKVKGVMEAESSHTLASTLRKKSITIISAERREAKSSATKTDRKSSFFTFTKKLKSDDLVMFFRQLSTMVEAGVQLVDSLNVLMEQAENAEFKRVIQQVKERVEAGDNFSKALFQHMNIFPQIAVSMIKAAEIGGNMGSILDQLATYVEDKDKIDKKIKSAMSYPKFILIFFGLVVSAVIFGLVPKFQEIFESFGAQLPGPTLAIIAIADFVKNNLLIEIALIVGAVFGFKSLKKNPMGRYFIDELKFKIPIAGEMAKKSTIARFCKTLGTLTKNSVTLVDALGISAETVNNVVIVGIIEEVKKAISGGSSLAKAMQEHVLFPTMMVKMIAVGEDSGALELMLGKISEFYDRQFNTSIDSLTAIIEPILMIGLGVLALVVVLALYLPIFQMTGAIHG
ncbi:MAG: type II secretion system F family protein [Candidatus Neomarinimicrobiota bacterium]